MRIVDKPQICQYMLDFLTLEEALATIDPIWNAGRKKRMLDGPGLCVAAIQDSNLMRRAALAQQSADFIHQPLRLERVGRLLHHPQQFAFASLGPQVLAQAMLVVSDQRVGGVQDMTEGSIVLLQSDDIAMGVPLLEISHIAHVG